MHIKIRIFSQISKLLEKYFAGIPAFVYPRTTENKLLILKLILKLLYFNIYKILPITEKNISLQSWYWFITFQLKNVIQPKKNLEDTVLQHLPHITYYSEKIIMPVFFYTKVKTSYFLELHKSFTAEKKAFASYEISQRETTEYRARAF